MTSITFDTLAYSKKLTKLGFTQEQAEGFARLAREQNEVNNAELQKQHSHFQSDITKMTKANEVTK